MLVTIEHIIFNYKTKYTPIHTTMKKEIKKQIEKINDLTNTIIERQDFGWNSNLRANLIKHCTRLIDLDEEQIG